MLYKFKSQAAAEVVLQKSNAEQFLTLIGHSVGVPGVIVVAQIPDAIAKLDAAISAQEAAQAKGIAQPALDSGDMTLRHRAGPFLELLQASLDAGKDVVWGV